MSNTQIDEQAVPSQRISFSNLSRYELLTKKIDLKISAVFTSENQYAQNTNRLKSEKFLSNEKRGQFQLEGVFKKWCEGRFLIFHPPQS